MHYINHNLRFFREYKRYNQTDMAQMLGITLGRYKQYEKVTYPPADMIIKMADVMNFSIDTLFKVKLSPKNYGKEEARIDAIERKLDQLLRQNDVSKVSPSRTAPQKTPRKG